MNRISITEVAPRDGWQSVCGILPTEHKLDLIELMVQAGVRHIQLGSFVSPKAIPQMADVRRLVQTLIGRHPKAAFSALVPNLYGARAAVESGLREITCVISVSESHNKANLNLSLARSFDELARIRAQFPALRIHLDAATAFGCPFEGRTSLDKLMPFLERAVRIGVDGIDLCDTIGVAHPSQIACYVSAVQRAFPNMHLAVHIHDTRNMGMLNTWTAIHAGVTSVQTALGGLGGCPFAPGASGNTATEDLVYLLEREGYDTGISFSKLLAAAKRMHETVAGNYSGHHLNIGADRVRTPNEQ